MSRVHRPRVKLSLRLSQLVDQLHSGWPVWDLCCDHGLVGQRALAEGEFPFVHFVDKSVPVVDRLISETELRYATQVERGELRISRADILEMELPKERANLVVAGVGARLICRFIDRLSSQCNLVLVLSPNKNPQEVLDKLVQSGWQVAGQTAVTESGRERWIFKAVSNHHFTEGG
ncbi:MAG: tRNA (adenine(22)-N(1))-methyltransferase TrmK [Bdellovibrionales bacterium]|nr:tRNA (adenine(22)-N(1))-methyltransferase TrmK [Bdellovibrionales bacterium]